MGGEDGDWFLGKLAVFGDWNEIDFKCQGCSTEGKFKGKAVQEQFDVSSRLKSAS
jgi:hypothetical protein